MENNPIDFVILWVDGNDPKWLAEKAKYRPRAYNDDGRERYRDWGFLKYWFRGVEKNAPWVRNIHFVTSGQIPEWLDTKNPKLNIVKHSNYIPADYLPTFSSHTIELNIHRIKGLSERFVYFNDDMFLINPVNEDFFFHDGLPRGMAVFNPPTTPDDIIQAVLNNDIRLINRNFDKGRLMKERSNRFLNIRYGKYNIRSLLCLPWKTLVGFYNPHVMSPLLKSTIEDVWSKEYNTLDRTCRNRFRSATDVNQYVFTYWQYCTGQFVPSPKMGEAGSIFDDIERCCKLIGDKKVKSICLNDSDRSEEEFLKAKERLIGEFERAFPDKSSFEI